MADEHKALVAVEGSNLAGHHKSSIRRYAERMLGKNYHEGKLSMAGTHAREAVHAFRQAAEVGLAGAALGALDAKNGGLDAHVKGHDVPMDLTGGLALTAASVAFAHEDGVSTTTRNVGTFGIGVFAMRKTKDFVAKKLASPGAAARRAGAAHPANKVIKAHGDGEFGADVDIGEDPVIAEARKMGAL